MRVGRINFIAAAFGAVGLVSASGAFAADVSLDDIAVKQDDPDTKVVIKHVDVKNSSLSADDVKKLLSGELSPDDQKAMAKTFKADSVTISAIESTNPKAVVTVKSIVAAGVDSGKIAKLDVAGADIKADEGGGHAGALHAENLNFASALDAAEHKRKLGTMGLTALTFEGLDMQVPMEEMPKDAPGGRLTHVTVGPVAVSATYDGEFPTKSDIAVKGVTVQLPDASPEGKQLKAFGVDKVQIDAHIASTCDKAAKTCNLSDFTLNLPNLGAITLTGNFGNMPTDLSGAGKDAAVGALMQEQIADLQLKFVNAGLYEKATDFAAASKHMSGQMMRAGMPMMAMMVPQMLGDPDAGKKVGDALNAFFKDPKSLTVSLKAKGAPVAISDLAASPNPADIFKKMSLDASAGK